MAFSEEEAQPAYDDLLGAEPAICIAADGVYVATRTKRAVQGPLRAAQNGQGGRGARRYARAGGAAEEPLGRARARGGFPYNTFLAGLSKLDKELPPSLGAVNTTSNGKCTTTSWRGATPSSSARRVLIASMLRLRAEVQVYAASQKDCVIARQERS